MKGVLDSMELRILKRVDNMRERESVISLERHMFKAEWNTVSYLSWVGHGRAHSLLSLAFAARWNPKQSSYCKYSVLFIMPSRSSAADSKLYKLFKATDKWNVHNIHI